MRPHASIFNGNFLSHERQWKTTWNFGKDDDDYCIVFLFLNFHRKRLPVSEHQSDAKRRTTTTTLTQPILACFSLVGRFEIHSSYNCHALSTEKLKLNRHQHRLENTNNNIFTISLVKHSTTLLWVQWIKKGHDVVVHRPFHHPHEENRVLMCSKLFKNLLHHL
jgi:hypothetical protein